MDGVAGNPPASGSPNTDRLRLPRVYAMAPGAAPIARLYGAGMDANPTDTTNHPTALSGDLDDLTHRPGRDRVQPQPAIHSGITAIEDPTSHAGPLVSHG